MKLTTAQVGVFTSWDVFDAIVEHQKGTLTAMPGFEPFESTDPDGSGAQPAPDGNAHALEFGPPRHLYIQICDVPPGSARPRVMYLALGETDDWAHDGRYDRVLEAYERTDGYLKELWAWLQADPDYRGRTHILITTDHGRGRTSKDWRDHGAKVEGAQDVWIALVSPSSPARGEWRDHPAIRTNQVAATLAKWMGIDWNALRPAAGLPISATR